MATRSDYAVVEKALRFLEENHLRQPSLEELSQTVGLSPFHLQRTFTRWAGVSPKRFLQFLTVEHAKNLLLESEPILAAAFESGLSGPARLHDLFITTEGVTPGEYKSRGLTVEIAYGVHSTPFGPALLGKTSRGLCHLSFLPSSTPDSAFDAVSTLREHWPRARVLEAPDKTEEMARRIFSLDPYSTPKRPLALLLRGTNFQIKVWNALLRVPPGAVITYGRLASELGAPKSARAVGSAVSRNPIAYLIPCHRVIRGMGLFGEYRWDPLRKKAILAWEASKKDLT